MSKPRNAPRPSPAFAACSYCLWGMSHCPLGNFYCPCLPGISQPMENIKAHATSGSQVTLEKLFCPGSVQGENCWGVQTSSSLEAAEVIDLGGYLHSGDAVGRGQRSAEMRCEAMALRTVPGGQLGQVLEALVWAQRSAQCFGCVFGTLWCLDAPWFSLCTPVCGHLRSAAKGQTAGSWATVTLPWPDRIDKSQGD